MFTNYDKNNLNNIDSMINNSSLKNIYRPIVNESGHSKVKINKNSRKKCAKALIK